MNWSSDNQIMVSSVFPNGMSGRRLALSLVGLTMIGILLVVFRPPMLPPLQATLAALICGLGTLPIVVRLAQPPSVREPVPLMSAVGGFYIAFFGAPTFLTYTLWDEKKAAIEYYAHVYIEHIETEALVLVLVGITIMFSTWAVARGALRDRTMRMRLPYQLTPQCADPLFLLLMVGCLAYATIPALRQIPSIGQFLQPAGYVAFGYFALSYHRGHEPTIIRSVFLLAALPAWLISLLIAGALTPLIMVVVLWVFVHVAACGRLPLRRLLISAVVIGALYPGLNTYRYAIWNTDTATTAGDKIGSWANTIIHQFTPNGGRHMGVERFVRRVNMMLPLSRVVAETPTNVDFWNGETYKGLLSSWIPRALWADKPREEFGNLFGLRYGIISPTEGNMSVNIPWITEMYANFGRAGIVVGMAIIGLLLAFLQRFLSHREATEPELAIGLVILLPLWFQESNFSLVTGSLLPLAISMWLYLTCGGALCSRFGVADRSRRSSTTDLPHDDTTAPETGNNARDPKRG